jgi:hypothetical protein
MLTWRGNLIALFDALYDMTTEQFLTIWFSNTNLFHQSLSVSHITDLSSSSSAVLSILLSNFVAQLTSSESEVAFTEHSRLPNQKLRVAQYFASSLSTVKLLEQPLFWTRSPVEHLRGQI